MTKPIISVEELAYDGAKLAESGWQSIEGGVPCECLCHSPLLCVAWIANNSS